MKKAQITVINNNNPNEIFLISSLISNLVIICWRTRWYLKGTFAFDPATPHQPLYIPRFHPLPPLHCSALSLSLSKQLSVSLYTYIYNSLTATKPGCITRGLCVGPGGPGSILQGGWGRCMKRPGPRVFSVLSHHHSSSQFAKTGILRRRRDSWEAGGGSRGILYKES